MSYTLVEYVLYPFYRCLLIIWYFPMVLIGMCRSKKMCVPLSVLPEILLLPAHELVKQIVNQEITSRCVVEAYISRMNEVNPVINAIVENCFTDALKEADAVDQKIQGGTLTKNELLKQFPLLGVPITVKESIGVKNMSNAAGYYLAKGRRALEDAEIVKLCRQAGGIVLAVTNTPELCMNWESHNNLTGLTRNPYDTRRTSGGSSGGEAALLGAGASLLGLGSDLGGSLRLPAHYCGVFCHKPTGYVVSTVGHYPDCPSSDKWNKNFALGPLSRYAGDLLPMMKVLTKNEYRTQMKLDRGITLSKVKVFYTKNYGSILCSSLDGQISAEFDSLLDHFRFKHDLKVEELDKTFLKNTIIPVLHVFLEIEGVEFERPKSGIFLDMLKVFFHCTKLSFNLFLFGILEKYKGLLSESRLRNDNKIIDKLREQLENTLGDDGVLLMPTFHRPANYHYTTMPTMFDVFNAALFNVLSMPVSNCPIGFHSNGLPFGIQVIARRYNDVLCMAVAEEIEKICGGWRIP